jgi:hypothetical protein
MTFSKQLPLQGKQIGTDLRTGALLLSDGRQIATHRCTQHSWRWLVGRWLYAA